MISVDGGKWYAKKVQEVLSKVPKQDSGTSPVPLLPVTGWKKFPSGKIPKDFCYGTIYEHIISSAKLIGLGGEPDVTADVNTSKPMSKGRWFFKSRNVKEMQDSWKDNYYFVKAVVQASYSEDDRNVSVTLRGDDAFVVDASCDCKASEMGRCNHVAAVLFAVEDFTMKYGFEAPACTSITCSWNVGRKKQKNPQPAHEIQYSRRVAPDRIINYDPRPAAAKEPTSKSNNEFEKEFIRNLPVSGPNPVFGHLLQLNYEDYDVDIENLKECVLSAEKDIILQMSDNNSPFEVPGTRQQAISKEWVNARSFRVTASVAKDVLGFSSKRSQYHFLQRHLWGLGHDLQVKSVVYGKTNEDNGFQQYVRESTRSETVTKTGFWVNPKYPQLGCSPDGLIFENDSLKGVLEIKCPAVLEKTSPVDISKLPNKQSKNLCFTLVNNVPRLKRTHKYYYQVQLQIIICEVSFCDFVIWSPKGMSVERIMKDEEFVQSVLPRLQRFHRNVLLPEYLEMRVPRKLLPFTL